MKTPVPQLCFNKRLWTRVFSCEFCRMFKNIFFTEHLAATASDDRLN